MIKSELFTVGDTLLLNSRQLVDWYIFIWSELFYI